MKGEPTMQLSHRTALVALALMLAVGTAACRREREAPPPEPAPAVTETATASIIRPEVIEAPEPEPAPEPLNATIGFPGGGARLDGQARAKLDEVLESEQVAQGWPLVLRGHTDSSGHDGDNLVVSRRRAEAVAAYLVEKGLAEDRISIVALGEQRPVAPHAELDGTPDEEGRARNRRVEIEISLPAKAERAPSGSEQREAQQPADTAQGA